MSSASRGFAIPEQRQRRREDLAATGTGQALMANRRTLLKGILIVCVLGAVAVFHYLNNVNTDRLLNLLGHRKFWGNPGPYHVAYPQNYKFIMDDTPTCKTTTPFLIIMVPVAPSDVKRRNAIRETWGSEKLVLGQLVETVFIMGLPGGDDAEQQQERLKQESQQHHDLIQSNFQDSYRNLTIKTMVMLEWLVKSCVKSFFVIKIDSDMFLHVNNLVKLLLLPGTAYKNYMTGLVWWNSPVLRDPFNKFYLPTSVFSESVYPPYPLGMAYVMSLDLPAKILEVSPQIKPIYIEDAYLGMCLKRLGIPPTNPPAEHMFLVTPKHPLSRCDLSKVIAMTTESISQMKGYWDRSRKEPRC